MSFLDTPFNLGVLDEKIRKNLEKTKGSKNSFLLLDSILSLLFYNSVEDTEKFLASIRKISKEYNITCVIILPEKIAQSLNRKKTIHEGGVE